MNGAQLREFCRALDIDWPCTPQALDDARRLQVQVWHPDKHQQNERLRRAGEEKIKRINVAYEKLKHYLQDGAPHCGSCGEPTRRGEACASCHEALERRRREDAAVRKTAEEAAARAHQAAAQQRERESAVHASSIRGTWRPLGWTPGLSQFEFSGRGPLFQLRASSMIGQTDEGVARVEGNCVQIEASNVFLGRWSCTLTVDGNRMHGFGSLFGVPVPMDLWRA